MKIIGHRGARSLAPENTAASFHQALACRVDAVEFDLRTTRDGTVVIHHNPSFISKGQERVISECTYADLLRAKPGLMTFPVLLALVGHDTPLLVEIKPRADIRPIVPLLRAELAARGSRPNLTVCSFDQAILRDIKSAFPGLPLMVIEIWSSWRARRRARELGTRQIALFEAWVWPGFIRAMKRGGYELYVYPATNDRKKAFFRRIGRGGVTDYPARAERWARAGLAGIVTDHPDRFTK